MIAASTIPTSAAKLARDLRADLRHLKSRGIDPATFLNGTLARICRKAEKAAHRDGGDLPALDTAWYGQHCRVA